MPVALAVLLTFLLKPLVDALERHHFRRPVAVCLVVVMIVAGMLGVGWQVGAQLTDLAGRLPTYQEHLRTKLADLRGSGNFFKQIRDAVHDIQGVGQRTSEESVKKKPTSLETAAQIDAQTFGGRQDPVDREKDAEADPEAPSPPEVRVVPEEVSPLEAVRPLIGSFGEFLGTSAVVIVLVIFMLIEFDDVRDRLVRVAGTSRLTITTKTLDEAGRRIGRYLLMNALVNGGFGLTIWLGLSMIGIDYAPVWGLMASLFRFVPYIGPIAAFVLPFSMAVIQDVGWSNPALVAALFTTVELTTNLVIEPLFYGKSAGVSTVALLISATFWTWVWGPMGLILSVPMTVVFAVLGKYIPHLEPLQILLGDAPALAAHVRYYQRLLAGDLDDAAELLEEAYQSQSLVEVYDDVLIPALAQAERDFDTGQLSMEEKQTVWQTTRSLIAENTPGGKAAAIETGRRPPQRAVADADAARRVFLVGVPAFDVADELALTMLQHLVAGSVDLKVLPTGFLTSEVLVELEREPPDCVWISALGPGGVGQTRYLCKRIHQSCPQMRIYIGRWGFRGDKERMAEGLRARGADLVVTTLAEACDRINRIQALQPRTPIEPAVTLAIG